jgi:hypothetical protein
MNDFMIQKSLTFSSRKFSVLVRLVNNVLYSVHSLLLYLILLKIYLLFKL